MGTPGPLTGPDLEKGIESSELPEDDMLLGHAHGLPVLLVCRQGEVFALGATCTHYGAPLVDGVLVGHELHCPWHHACFDVRNGEAVSPPALEPLPCWRVEQRGTRLVVGETIPAQPKRRTPLSPHNVVIVGAGAAGNSAAETLRAEGYSGPITVIGDDPNLPVDRPNLSKDYLAGTAEAEWLSLRGKEFYQARRIELLVGLDVLSIDTKTKQLQLSDGSSRSYASLLIATGAVPIKLKVPGSDRPHVHCLRSLADAQAIIANADESKRAIVVGGSFIAMEVAAALRTRGLAVDVVAPAARPLERVLGPGLGDFVRGLHEDHGVHFHLQHKLKSIAEHEVLLDDDTALAADLVVTGVGVRPAVRLAENAGLRVNNGVVVDEYLESSVPGIYAAGDIARWPSPDAPQGLRVEHWVVAQRQGQTAARNILGKRKPFRSIPFFWSQHYDVRISYVGHAEAWDRIEVAGSIADQHCMVAFRVARKIVAVATIGRDKDSLLAEALLASGDQAGLEALLADAAG